MGGISTRDMSMGQRSQCTVCYLPSVRIANCPTTGVFFIAFSSQQWQFFDSIVRASFNAGQVYALVWLWVRQFEWPLPVEGLATWGTTHSSRTCGTPSAAELRAGMTKFI